MGKSKRGPDPARGLVTLPGGDFMMGTTDADANPADAEVYRREHVAPFRMAATTVTNAQFAAFAKATGYVTTAEREGWSAVFHLLVTAQAHRSGQVSSSPGLPWWSVVRGASWRAPFGQGSSYSDRAQHPVVHISQEDALAYCAWAGLRLPTEREWEYAARGGLYSKRFPWGDDLEPDGYPRCNIFRGDFPNRADDPRWTGTVKVKSYPANGFGLYEMTGNVWEWTADPWNLPTADGACCSMKRAAEEAGAAGEVVIRGGSYLCHDSYCNRYRVSARTHTTADSSTSNQGFRVAGDVA